MVTSDTNKLITISNVRDVLQTEKQVSQNSTPQFLSNTTVINSAEKIKLCSMTTTDKE